MLEHFPIRHVHATLGWFVTNDSSSCIDPIRRILTPFRPQIALAVAVFHDKMTWLKVVGLVVAIQGSIIYKASRPNPRTGEGRAGKDDR